MSTKYYTRMAGKEINVLGYGRDRDTSRWGEGDKVWLQDVQASAVRAVGRGVLQFDSWNGELVVTKRRLGVDRTRTSKAVNKLAEMMGTVKAFEYLKSQGCAYGVISRENVHLYNH